MSALKYFFTRVTAGLIVTVFMVSTGCVGYVDGGGGVVVGPGPGPYIYGDFYDHGHDVHAFRDRGFRSRGIAHGGGGGRRR